MRGRWTAMGVVALQCARAGGADLGNYWVHDGERLSFRGGALAVEASLPRGFVSLKVDDDEFLAPGDGFGGIVFRRPDGTIVSSFTSVDNVAHDARQGRKGSVSDGMYLLTVTTAWSLPDFEIYAGFNDTNAHDVVVFFGEGVRALRVTSPGAPLSAARQNVLADSAVGTSQSGAEVAAVHESGKVLRLGREGGLAATVLAAPDGKPRLAVVIPCQGMAANTVRCRYGTDTGADGLVVDPRFSVDSPTMGRGTTGYKPQSNGPWALYEKGAKLDYRIAFGWLGRRRFDGKIVAVARHALGETDFRIEAPARETAPGRYEAVLHPAFRLPGVSDVNVHLVDAAGVVLATERLRVLYDWPGYRPRYRAPADLKAFWDATLAELAKVPLNPKVEAGLFKDDPAWRFEHVSFNGWKGGRVHACLYIPKDAKGPLPVIVTAHPGTRGFGANPAPDGVYGSKVKCDPRFVTIVPLIRGHAPDAADVPFNQPWWGPPDSRDDYAARAWYCAMVRALDYLATRPEIADLSRVASVGGSQGGALALALAALDRRVALCGADSPSNSMHHDAVRPGTYGTFGPTAGQVPAGQTLDDLLRTLSYYDPAHLAPWIACPTVIHLTVGDLTVHSMGGLGVFKNLTGLPEERKWFLPGVNGHYHAGSAAGAEKLRELKDALVAGQPLP